MIVPLRGPATIRSARLCPIGSILLIILVLIEDINALIASSGLILAITTTHPNTTLFLPFGPGGSPPLPVNITVSWGQALINPIPYTSAPFNQTFGVFGVSFVYPSAGDYIVHVLPNGEIGSTSLPAFGWNPLSSKGWSALPNLVVNGVTAFGDDLGIQSLAGAFFMCPSIFSVPTSIPATATSLNSMFRSAKAFNASMISSWDVSQVTDMDYMFAGATAFNQPIGSWDVSSVQSMNAMFYGATDFNQPLSAWNVSSVTSMESMFYDTKFNQSISSWNVNRVTSMAKMFQGAQRFNQPIGAWNVSSVTSMQNMFVSAALFNQPIGSWNVSRVTSMSSMFANAGSFNQPIGTWDVSNVIFMNSMFMYTSNFNKPIGSWNVSKVSSMSYMFGGAISFNQPLCNWNVSSVVTMDSMFRGATSFNQSVDAWDVSRVTTMASMFNYAVAFNQYIGSWDVSEVTSMANMFENAASFNQPLNSWNVGSVTAMSSMFSSAMAFNQSLDAWDVTNVSKMDSMFLNAISFNQSLRQWCAPSVTYRPALFANGSGLSLFEEPEWATCPAQQPAVSSATPAPVLPTTIICTKTNLDGSCFIQGNLTIPVDVPVFVINASIVINGSLTLQPNSTLQLQPGALLNVSGCVVIAGNLTVVTNAPTQSVTGQAILVLQFDGGYCDDQEDNRFEDIVLTFVDNFNCHAQPNRTQTVYYPSSVSLLFDFDRSSCSNTDSNSITAISSGAVAGIVIAAVVLLVILVASVVLVRFKYAIRPYAQRPEPDTAQQRLTTL